MAMAMASWRRARKKGARSFHGDGPPPPLPSKRKQDPAENRSRKRARRAPPRTPDSTVFVGDLHLATTSERLKAFFENYGEVAKAKVVPEQGYGFVTFEAREIAEGVIVAAAGKEGVLMGNRKIRVSWASSPLPQRSTIVPKLPMTSDFKKRRVRQAPPRRYRSRLFLTAVASAVASATAEAVIQGNGPGPSVQEVGLPNREVIAYDDWL